MALDDLVGSNKGFNLRDTYEPEPSVKRLEENVKRLEKNVEKRRTIKRVLVSIAAVFFVLSALVYLWLLPAYFVLLDLLDNAHLQGIERGFDLAYYFALFIEFGPAITLLCAIFGAIIALRAERRATVTHKLELEKLQLEISKLKSAS
jgi:hypothetical protein